MGGIGKGYVTPPVTMVPAVGLGLLAGSQEILEHHCDSDEMIVRIVTGIQKAYRSQGVLQRIHTPVMELRGLVPV